MSGDLITEITIFVLAVFVGFEVISKVPTMLHTPLMSGTNAIHGIVLLGGIIVLGVEGADTLVKIAGTVFAVAFGTINIVGGFLRHRPHAGDVQGPRRSPRAVRRTRSLITASFVRDIDFINSAYLVASVLFILGIRGLSHPRTARQGNITASIGMLIAVVATLLHPDVENYGLIAVGIAIGAVIGVVSARAVKMTAMPQMVALFNGVGGGAVAMVALVGVPRADPGTRRDPARDAAPDAALVCDRRRQLLRLADRVREAAGADDGTADRVPRQPVRQRRPAAGHRLPRRLPRHRPGERGPVHADAVRGARCSESC